MAALAEDRTVQQIIDIAEAQRITYEWCREAGSEVDPELPLIGALALIAADHMRRTWLVPEADRVHELVWQIYHPE